VSQYQKGKTNLDFTEATDSEWQWHQLGCMQVCTSLQTDNHASTPPLSFIQAGCPSCRPTNSVKALKATKQTKTSASTDDAAAEWSDGVRQRMTKLDSVHIDKVHAEQVVVDKHLTTANTSTSVSS